jgi:3,4-dihydroxy 2-butanone 4-phosphate synthase/GTP cyclohydrolase II
MAGPLENLLARVPSVIEGARRPSVTLSYAQSLDGSIGTASRKPLPLSGPESLAATHHLRAAHDAVLVGIGTVVSDNPQLTVRYATGEHPQPVVLDSHLRIPREASLWKHPKPLLIACLATASRERRQELEAAGGRVIALPPSPEGRVSLPALLDRLTQLGIETLMVEGGAQVITSFVREKLADALAITVTPALVGGLQAIEGLGPEKLQLLPTLNDPGWGAFGSDLMVWGEIVWPAQ